MVRWLRLAFIVENWDGHIRQWVDPLLPFRGLKVVMIKKKMAIKGVVRFVRVSTTSYYVWLTLRLVWWGSCEGFESKRRRKKQTSHPLICRLMTWKSRSPIKRNEGQQCWFFSTTLFLLQSSNIRYFIIIGILQKAIIKCLVILYTKLGTARALSFPLIWNFLQLLQDKWRSFSSLALNLAWLTLRAC